MRPSGKWPRMRKSFTTVDTISVTQCTLPQTLSLCTAFFYRNFVVEPLSRFLICPCGGCRQTAGQARAAIFKLRWCCPFFICFSHYSISHCLANVLGKFPIFQPEVCPIHVTVTFLYIVPISLEKSPSDINHHCNCNTRNYWGHSFVLFGQS